MSFPLQLAAASPEFCATGSWLLAGRGRPSPRRRGQAVVEFGLVVLLFVFLIFGIVDFGVLLNARLSLSSMSRVLARAAAENASESELLALAQQQDRVLGVSTATYSPYLGFSDKSPNAAIVISMTYYDPSGSPINPPTKIAPGDTVKIDVVARGTEVLTPLVRPIFGCKDGTQTHCYVPLSAETTMRVELTYPTPTPGP